jgi:translocation and assembly module TamB
LTDEAPPPPAPEPPAQQAARRRARWGLRKPRSLSGWVLAIALSVLAVVALLIGATRLGVLTPQARLLIEARTDGLKLGRFGRLKLEGLEGDVWRRFTVRRATISDEKGVWLEARRVTIDWRYSELLRRRLVVNSLTAEQVQLVRRPTLEPKGVSKGMPLSVFIDDAKARIELLPAFSGVRGVYAFHMDDLDVRRGGGTRLSLEALSQLHPGDYARARINLGRDKTLLVNADANEARGGAIAGALGLRPDQPFWLRARVTGTVSRGQMALVSRSGDKRPIEAGGAWGPGGGAINARVLMESSRLLAWWGKRLGPEAQLAIVGRRDAKGTYSLQARVTADNLLLTANGPFDPGKFSTPGLRAQMHLDDLTPFFSFPEFGAVNATGVFKGKFTDFDIQAQGEVLDITNGDYRIDRAYGPTRVLFKKGEFLVSADLKSQGSRGTGWQWAVAGPQPSGSFDLVRLRDGRVLFKAIHADGRGLDLDGTGEVGLFNRLNFKGKARVFNLAQAHKGAGGSANFAWTASQADVESPWNFVYEGGAENFTSGYPDLDRVVGRSPRVSGTASLLRDVLTVPKIDIIGATAQASARGVQQPDGAIRYDGTWSAKGPFPVGPLEVTGDVRGTGTITNNWLQPHVDLMADIDTLALPWLTVKDGKLAISLIRDNVKDTSAGGIAITGGSDYGPARAKAGFRFIGEDGVDLQDIDADLGGVRAQGAIALRANTPSSADLQVAVGPGAILTEGSLAGTVKLVDRLGGAIASVRMESKGAVLRGSGLVLEAASVTADGPVSRLPYRIETKGGLNRNPLSMSGSGIISQQGTDWSVDFSGNGALRTTRFETLEPIQVRFGKTLKTLRVRAVLGGGRASVDARQDGETLTANAALQGVDVRFLSEDFVGRFDANMTLNGKGRQLTGALDAKLDGARSRDAPTNTAINGTIRASLTDNRILIDASAAGAGGLRSSANFSFPAEASASPFRIAIARNAPMQGRFEADGEVQPLWDLFFGGERTLGGKLVTRGTLGGSLNDPRINGEASLQNGRFEDFATGLRLTDIDMQADLLGGVVRVSRFTAKDGVRGTVSGSGRASLERNGGSDFILKLADFRLIDNEIAVADASGDVTLTRGAQGNVKIVGDLTVNEAEINAAARLATNVPTMAVREVNRPISLQTQLAPVVRQGPGVALDVRLRAPRRIFVRGRGLDMEMSLNAHVTGTTTEPELSGTARIVRGEYEFAGKTFDFDERGLVQLSTKPHLIRLDLQAVREDPSLTAVVRILGTAAKPEITLTSTPVLPNDEVLSQVLFGRSASQLSPLEAAQLASALTGLAGGGGFDVIGNLRSFAGLDRLAFAGGGQQAVSVAGGKYLTDDVYLEIAGGGRDGPSAQVEYRVSRSLSVISRLTSETGAKLAVRWRRDLGDRRRGPARR